MEKTTLKVLGFTELIAQEHSDWAVKQLKDCGCRITAIEPADNFHVAITYIIVVA